MTRIQKIKNVIVKKPFVFYFILIFLGYLGLNFLLNQSFITLPTLFKTYKFSFSISFAILTLITAILVAININLVIIKFKELKLLNDVKGLKGSGGITSLGIFGGLLGGACPGCFVGLFPAFVGLFGITATLSNLPLFGLEIQILSSGLLILSTFLLTKDNTCKIDIKK